MGVARAMWTLFEPIHDVTYFDPRSLERFSAVGLRGFWRSYFASRSAPLGPIGPAPVIAAFFSFAPSMVTRALPAVWELASPDAVLAARAEGSAIALRGLLDVPVERVDEAAGLLEAAVSHLDPAGRVLGAANLALPRYEDPYARLHQATTTLREHRGDGHVAALVASTIGPVEVLALRSGIDMRRDVLQPARGWTDEEWSAAQDRLVARGWLDADHAATTVGREAFAAVEEATNRAAESPWTAIGPDATQRVTELLTPMTAACRAVSPSYNPVGLPS
jgi:hypothetical protein